MAQGCVRTRAESLLRPYDVLGRNPEVILLCAAQCVWRCGRFARGAACGAPLMISTCLGRPSWAQVTGETCNACHRRLLDFSRACDLHWRQLGVAEQTICFRSRASMSAKPSMHTTARASLRRGASLDTAELQHAGVLDVMKHDQFCPAIGYMHSVFVEQNGHLFYMSLFGQQR